MTGEEARRNVEREALGLFLSLMATGGVIAGLLVGFGR